MEVEPGGRGRVWWKWSLVEVEPGEGGAWRGGTCERWSLVEVEPGRGGA